MTRPYGHLLRDIEEREIEFEQLLRSIKKDMGTPYQKLNLKQLMDLKSWCDVFYRSLEQVNDPKVICSDFNIAQFKAKSLLARVEMTIDSLPQM